MIIKIIIIVLIIQLLKDAYMEMLIVIIYMNILNNFGENIKIIEDLQLYWQTMDMKEL